MLREGDRNRRSEALTTSAVGHPCIENVPINGFEQRLTVLPDEAFSRTS